MDETTLQQSLLTARRFMNHDKLQTESSVSKKSTIPQSTPIPESVVSRQPVSQQPVNPMPHNTPPGTQQFEQPRSAAQMDLKPHSKLTRKSIMSSNLPDAVKKAMIDNPIPDINTGANLSPQFMNEVAEKMNNQDYSVDGMRQQSNSNIPNIPNLSNVIKENNTQPSPIPPPQTSFESSSLKSEIKSMITETLDELIEAKINKALLGSTNIKENLALRVGNKVFTGKLSKVKTLKS